MLITVNGLLLVCLAGVMCAESAHSEHVCVCEYMFSDLVVSLMVFTQFSCLFNED